ncbi:hypothetical protein L227DRAFT_575458 [Lentinus tigrinus ALCF2SS1-6]|uniref:Uncharacterized protein n=2 Tax=Lentinus tigrinus TaxID=5365 RepID=A0A5C2SB85_9APHY|nr:hypothetical protein L227DRAFT_575458 [Lentinus tigrinus ALCF2SS1-6]
MFISTTAPRLRHLANALYYGDPDESVVYGPDALPFSLKAGSFLEIVHVYVEGDPEQWLGAMHSLEAYARISKGGGPY